MNGYNLNEMFSSARTSCDKFDFRSILDKVSYDPGGENTSLLEGYIGTISRVSFLLSGITSSVVENLKLLGENEERSRATLKIILTIAVAMGLREENYDILSLLYNEEIVKAASSFPSPEKGGKVVLERFIDDLIKSGVATVPNKEEIKV